MMLNTFGKWKWLQTGLVMLVATGVATAATVTFDAATLGGTGDLGVDTLTINDVGGLVGVDLTLTASDAAGPTTLIHEQVAGNANTGQNVDGVGTTPGASGVQGNEVLGVNFSTEVFITQIVLRGVGRNDDQMQFTGLADNFPGTIALSFNTLGTLGVDAIATFGLDTANPIVNANANTGDGNGMDIEGGGGFAFGLVVDFDTPVNSDGFDFRADQFGQSAQGVAIQSISFTEIPEPGSLMLLSAAALLALRRR